jgi:putative phosphoesterase
MRIALISDLHGNIVSLEATLADIDRRGVDEIVCLGDVATLGPRPNDVIEILERRGCRCVLGNHDDFMLDEELIRSYTDVPIVVDAVDWCRDRLSKDEIAFLSRFEENIPVELGKNATAFWFHGSPRSHMEDLLATTPPELLDEALCGSRATVLAGGHTHIQMLRQHHGMLLVNPGSVGMPFREYACGGPPHILPHAEYAIVDASEGSVGVTLCRVDVDRDRLRREAAASDNPICRALENSYA